MCFLFAILSTALSRLIGVYGCTGLLSDYPRSNMEAAHTSEN